MISLLVIQLAMTSHPGICTQKTYDEVYKAITLEALQEQDPSIPSDRRFNAIQALRKICSGQISSWEKKNKYPVSRLK